MKTLFNILILSITIIVFIKASYAQYMPQKWKPAITYYRCIGTGEILADRCWRDGREYGEQLVDYEDEIKFYVGYKRDGSGSYITENYPPDDISDYNFINFTSGIGNIKKQEFSWKADRDQLDISIINGKTHKYQIEDEIYLSGNGNVYLRGDKATCRELPLGERKLVGKLWVNRVLSVATDRREPDIRVKIGDESINLNPDKHDMRFLLQFYDKDVELTYEIFQHWDRNTFSNPNNNLCKKRNILKSIKLIKNVD